MTDDLQRQSRDSPPEGPEHQLAGGECPVVGGIDVVGGKWKLLIVRVLMADGPLRFNQLKRAVPGISDKVLTQNLRALEGDQLLFGDAANQGAYTLTEAGHELTPILHALGEWRMRLEREHGV